VSEYPECEKLAEASKVTQPIGEFLDWLNSQGIHLMTYREDLTDSRPTDPDCRKRRRLGHEENRKLPCWPTHESDIGGADYYDTHCLHWHGREYEEGDSADVEPGTCCFCGKGRHYEVTGLKAWVSDPRNYEQLLADFAGVDLKKVDTERRQMLASLREANEAL
jgi:hypothetical protein